MKRYDVRVLVDDEGQPIAPSLMPSPMSDLDEPDARWWCDRVAQSPRCRGELVLCGERVSFVESSAAASRANRFPSQLWWHEDELIELRGSDQHEQRTRFADAQVARRAFERRRRQLEARGVAVYDDLQALHDALAARDAELERALLEAPDDRERLAVYGDWLAQQDDPRGGLIARSLAGHERVTARYLRAYRRHLLGPLAWQEIDGLFDLSWRYGFIRSATLLGGPALSDARCALRALLALPVALLLEQLGCLDGEQTSLFEALAGLEVPPLLRRVGVVQSDQRVFGYISTPPAALGRFEELHLCGGYFAVEALPLADTRTLVVGGRFDVDVLRLLARALPPRLRRLELRYHSFDPAGHDALRALLDSPRAATQIVELVLRTRRLTPLYSENTETFTRRAVQALCQGELLAALRELELGDEISPATAKKLLARSGHLHSLRLWARPEQVAEIRALAEPLARGDDVSVQVEVAVEHDARGVPTSEVLLPKASS